VLNQANEVIGIATFRLRRQARACPRLQLRVFSWNQFRTNCGVLRNLIGCKVVVAAHTPNENSDGLQSNPHGTDAQSFPPSTTPPPPSTTHGQNSGASPNGGEEGCAACVRLAGVPGQVLGGCCVGAARRCFCVVNDCLTLAFVCWSRVTLQRVGHRCRTARLADSSYRTSSPASICDPKRRDHILSAAECDGDQDPFKQLDWPSEAVAVGTRRRK